MIGISKLALMPETKYIEKVGYIYDFASVSLDFGDTSVCDNIKNSVLIPLYKLMQERGIDSICIDIPNKIFFYYTLTGDCVYYWNIRKSTDYHGGVAEVWHAVNVVSVSLEGIQSYQKPLLTYKYSTYRCDYMSFKKSLV